MSGKLGQSDNPDAPGREAVVSRVLGLPVSRLTDVRRRPIEYDAFLAGRRLARIEGAALVEGDVRRWTLIEKRTQGPQVAPAYLYANSRREFLAYRSGLLAKLAPGVVAPRCYALDERPDGQLTLWLEDLGEQQRWTREDCLTAARHLGRLAGRWLDRVPADDWLFDGWIERHSQSHAQYAGLVAVREAAADSMIQGRLGLPLRDASKIIDDQRSYRAVLERLPTTLCHHDAVASNLFLRNGTVCLIDWEMIGPGPVGADLASLLFSSVRRGDWPAAWLAELRPAALAAYTAGLADSGADQLGTHDVLLGYSASVALRWTLLRDVIVAVRTGDGVRRGSAPAEPPDVALAELIALTSELFEAAARVRQLA